MMEKLKALFSLKKKGMADGIFNVVMGVVLIAIGILAVAYPIVISVVASLTNLSTTDALIVKYLGTLVLLVAFIWIASFMFLRNKA